MTAHRQSSRSPGPGQEMLFVDPNELAPYPVTPTEPEPGISVSVHDRAVHLTHALDLMGKANQRFGFQIASTDDRYRPQLQSRYGGNLNNVVKGAKDNEAELAKDAKWQFAYAGGYIALKHAGLLSPEEANKMAVQDFTDFHTKFGAVGQASQRNKFKRQLAKNDKKSHAA